MNQAPQAPVETPRDKFINAVSPSTMPAPFARMRWKAARDFFRQEMRGAWDVLIEASATKGITMYVDMDHHIQLRTDRDNGNVGISIGHISARPGRDNFSFTDALGGEPQNFNAHTLGKFRELLDAKIAAIPQAKRPEPAAAPSLDQRRSPTG